MPSGSGRGRLLPLASSYPAIAAEANRPISSCFLHPDAPRARESGAAIDFHLQVRRFLLWRLDGQRLWAHGLWRCRRRREARSLEPAAQLPMSIRLRLRMSRPRNRQPLVEILGLEPRLGMQPRPDRRPTAATTSISKAPSAVSINCIPWPVTAHCLPIQKMSRCNAILPCAICPARWS